MDCLPDIRVANTIISFSYGLSKLAKNEVNIPKISLMWLGLFQARTVTVRTFTVGFLIAQRPSALFLFNNWVIRNDNKFETCKACSVHSAVWKNVWSVKRSFHVPQTHISTPPPEDGHQTNQSGNYCSQSHISYIAQTLTNLCPRMEVTNAVCDSNSKDSNQGPLEKFARGCGDLCRPCLWGPRRISCNLFV